MGLTTPSPGTQLLLESRHLTTISSLPRQVAKYLDSNRGWQSRLGGAGWEASCAGLLQQLCYTQKGSNTWHRQGAQKTNDTYNQPKRPSIGTTQTPSNGHHRQSSPSVGSQNPIQHSNLQESSRRRSRVIAGVFSANAAQCTGGPGNTTTQPSPAPAGTRSTPLLGGPLSGGDGGQPRTHD